MPRPLASVAILSDIHGVMPALEAVLAEPEVGAADCILVNGDVAAGPQPVEVLDALMALGERVRWVSGNADRELLSLARGGTTAIPDPIAPWAEAQLSPAHLALMQAFASTMTLDIAGFGPVLFCHGSPRSDDEVLLVDTRISRWQEAFAGVPDSVRTVVCGHTHMPFLRLVDGRTVLNPGSVGMPYGRQGAHWALLKNGAISFRVTPLDPDKAIAAIAAGSGFPEARAWAQTYLSGTISDLDALRAFAPRDGRSV